MDSESQTPQEHGTKEFEDMFICSRCGYSRRSVEAVIEHLKSAHGGRGQVRNFQREKKPKGQLRRVLERLGGLLKLGSR